jgi:hypothetical protein
METQTLIKQLARAPDLRWSFGRGFNLALVASVVIAGAIFAFGVGVRPDIVAAAHTLRFPYKFVVTLAAALTAIGLARRLLQPGSPLGLWFLAPFAGPVLLLAAVAAELFSTPAASWAKLLIGSNSVMCLTLIPSMAAGPLVCLILAFRRGAPAHPGAAGMLAGLIASSIAATLYASRCTDDSPLFVATWYPLATAMVMAAGYVFGRFSLRW